MVGMTAPQVPDHVVRQIAARDGVCVRPVVRRVTDRVTGESVVRVLGCRTTLRCGGPRWTCRCSWSGPPCGVDGAYRDPDTGYALRSGRAATPRQRTPRLPGCP